MKMAAGKQRMRCFNGGINDGYLVRLRYQTNWQHKQQYKLPQWNSEARIVERWTYLGGNSIKLCQTLAKFLPRLKFVTPRFWSQFAELHGADFQLVRLISIRTRYLFCFQVVWNTYFFYPVFNRSSNFSPTFSPAQIRTKVASFDYNEELPSKSPDIQQEITYKSEKKTKLQRNQVLYLTM